MTNGRPKSKARADLERRRLEAQRRASFREKFREKFRKAAPLVSIPIAAVVGLAAGGGQVAKRVQRDFVLIERQAVIDVIGDIPSDRIEVVIQAIPELPNNLAGLDFDMDGDIDGVDYSVFASCHNGAGNPPRTLGCPPGQAQHADTDKDQDVDGADFARFQECYNGAGNYYGSSWCAHVLNRRYEIAGTITEPDGTPVPGVYVTAIGDPYE